MTDRGLCGYCDHPIPDRSASEYFCGSGCQDFWHRERSEPVDEVRLYHRWRDQAEQISAVMAELRVAFTGFGGAVQQACDAFDRLTDTQGTS